MPPSSSGSPLQNRAFRALWLASVFSYVGTWIQDVGESWLMLALTQSPMPVALLSTCTTLPAFLLTLPAGVIADRVDRRRLIILAQWWLAFVAFVLAVFTWTGHASPAALLVASAALGIGSAMTTPPWQSLLPDLVPRAQTADAVTWNAVAFNLARAIGPALGGLVLGAFGAGTAFFLNAVSFLAVIAVLARFEHIRSASARADKVRRPEPLRAAVLAGFREVLASNGLKRCFRSVAAFGFATAGVTALLPSFAKHVLHVDARGYGLMLGGLGAGAVLAAFLLPRLRASLHARALVGLAMAGYGVCAALLSRAHALAPVALLLVPAGVGWLSSFATMNALVQLNSKAWVKSRVLALYQTAFLAAWTTGATAAGALASTYGIADTITAFSLCALVAAGITVWRGLPTYEPALFDRGETLSTPPPASARVG